MFKKSLIMIGLFIYSTASATAQQSAPPLLEFTSITHPVTAKNGMVSSQVTLASQIGVDIMKQGGNAIDAAVATGFALAVTLPRAGNIAGGGFMLIYLAEEDRFVALDYKEMAPAAAHRDMYILPDGSVDFHSVRFTRKGFGVPGTVAAFAKALEDHGTMTLSQVLAPSIKAAREGIEVTQSLAFALSFAKDKLHNDPEARKIFFNPDGETLKEGDMLIQEDLAWSLEQIAMHGPDAFYKGEIAKKIVADMEKNDGLVTMDDMANYVVAERVPVKGKYRGHDLTIMPPPSSGGVHIIQMMNIFENFDIENMGHNSSATIHIMTEAMRQAYADRSKYLGDPDFNNIPMQELMSKEYAQKTLSQISMDKARNSIDVHPGLEAAPESPDTTHYSVIDKDGNIVSNTYSLNYTYGSGIIAEGTGILLNNVMDDFSAQPGAPNGYGLIGGEANSIAPKKRALSSMTPVIVTKDGKPYFVTGSPGGSRIITTNLQILMNVIDHKMNVAAATHAPRIHHQWLPNKVYIEPGISADTLKILKNMGHEIEPTTFTMGSTQTIMKLGDYLYGSADPRRPGAAAVGY